MKVLLARHCQTEWNFLGKAQGVTDVSLNNMGLWQAKKLAEKLSGKKIAKIFSSDLIRSKQTAQIVSEMNGIPYEYDARLREFSFGELEGLEYKEFIKKCGRLNMPDYHKPIEADFSIFGGEKGRDVLRKYISFLDEVLIKHSDQSILVIGHGKAIRLLMTELEWRVDFPEQGDYITVEYQGCGSVYSKTSSGST
jgi:broad specificity phosphatase PhoE